MRRIALIVTMAGLAVVSACTPQAHPIIPVFQSSPVLGVEQGFYTSCIIEEGDSVKISVGQRVWVQLTLPGGVVVAEPTVSNGGSAYEWFISDPLPAGTCWTINLSDYLGTGPFLFWLGLL